MSKKFTRQKTVLSSANGLALGEKRPRSLPALVVTILCLCLLQNYGGAPGYSQRSSTQSTFPGVQLFRGPYGTPPLFPALGLGTGPCFACGEYNHINRQCPHVNLGAGAIKVQSTRKQNSQTVTQNRASSKDEFDSELFTHD